ncbi:hypothetical protein VTO73DRAFT_9614 [Trametes versicolor]
MSTGHCSGEEYEPSQVLSDSDHHQRQYFRRTTRKASGRAKERISHAYDAGAILDSQTSDSQFIHAAESTGDVDSPSSHASAGFADDHAESDGGTSRLGFADDHAESDGGASRSYDDASSAEERSETDRVRRLEGDLRRAYAQIEFLRSQVEDLEEVGMIQHRRIGELQARILDEAFILDPEEQSQVLIPVASTLNNMTSGVHHRASTTRSQVAVEADGTRTKKRKLHAAA